MGCGSGHNIVLLETSQTGQTQDFAEKIDKITVLYSYYTILSNTCNNMDDKQPPKSRKFFCYFEDVPLHNN